MGERDRDVFTTAERELARTTWPGRLSDDDSNPCMAGWATRLRRGSVVEEDDDDMCVVSHHGRSSSWQFGVSIVSLQLQPPLVSSLHLSSVQSR
jgi:hypothetical protein